MFQPIAQQGSLVRIGDTDVTPICTGSAPKGKVASIQVDQHLVIRQGCRGGIGDGLLLMPAPTGQVIRLIGLVSRAIVVVIGKYAKELASKPKQTSAVRRYGRRYISPSANTEFENAQCFGQRIVD